MAGNPHWHPDEARGIVKRFVVEGTLALVSPAHLGNGDGTDSTDMPLLTDAEGGPLLTGTSLAGALRTYLCEREQGFRQKEAGTSASTRLFGGLREDPNGEQSTLVVEDAYGISPDQDRRGIETRYGIRLDPHSRTAASGALFDMELWQAGTTFSLRLELLVLATDKDGAIPEVELRAALATALAGLHEGDGGITLGARKRRGFGRVRAGDWRVCEYDLQTLQGLKDWVRQRGTKRISPDIFSLLNTTEITDARSLLTLDAEFYLTPIPGVLSIGSLLIRAGGGRDDTGPDMVHLEAHAENGTSGAPLSGTSAGGALRARCGQILHTLCAASGAADSPAKAEALVDDLFGPRLSDGGRGTKVEPRAGRLRVEEHLVVKPRTDLVQSRVSLDRFTGGARATALFNQQPVFSRGQETRVRLRLQLEDPQDHEAGLLLHLLKDLWTCDLPIGGESSVGRGRLWGHSARLAHSHRHWEILQTEPGLEVLGDKAGLEEYAGQLCDYLGVPREPKH